MLSILKTTEKYVAVVVAKDGQGLITIDDFSQLNDKSVESLCQLLRSPGRNTGGVSNHGVVVSVMAEAKLKGMIYYIKHIKRIGCTYTHVDVEISRVRAMYHQQEMEESHKDPEVVPTVDPGEWPKNLETVEDYIKGFCVVDGQTLSYGLMDDFISPFDASHPTYRANGSE